LRVPLAFVHVPAGERAESFVDRERNQSVFKSYALALDAGGFGEATAQVIDGSPAEAILKFAGERGLIVLSSHGRGGFRAALVGSVADKVVRGAAAPVLVVPAVDSVPDVCSGPFVIALDGSAQAEAGLRFGRELAAAASAKVTLVRAYNLAPPTYVEIGYYVPDVSEGLEEAARQYLRLVAAQGETLLLARGAADVVIADAANSADASLVIMTTEGLGRARRIALGSTTDRVLHSLRRPLFIIPPTVADGRRD
jgi:nucleotide-binding universal stress UspA family protein